MSCFLFVGLGVIADGNIKNINMVFIFLNLRQFTILYFALSQAFLAAMVQQKEQQRDRTEEDTAEGENEEQGFVYNWVVRTL